MAIVEQLQNLLDGRGQRLVDLSVMAEGAFVVDPIPMAMNELVRFPAGQLVERLIFDIRKQAVQFKQCTWQRIMDHHQRNTNRGYGARRDQIALEALHLHGKISADELYESIHLVQAVTAEQKRNRDDLMEKQFLAALTSVESANFALKLDNKSQINTRVKEFLLSERQLTILAKVLTVHLQPQQPYQAADIRAIITSAKVYESTKLGNLRGCAVRDGWIMCVSELAGISGDVIFWADILTLAMHEAAHYCARMSRNDYGFRSPSNGIEDDQHMRQDRGVAGKPLALGRAAELAIFDMQVEWGASTANGANDFLARAHEGRLPYESKEECLALGMVERDWPSISFGGDLINRRLRGGL